MIVNRPECANPEMAKPHPSELETGPWMLRGTGASDASFDTPEKFGEALRNAMNEAKDVELLFAIWEQNVDTVRAINKSVYSSLEIQDWVCAKLGETSQGVRHRACESWEWRQWRDAIPPRRAMLRRSRCAPRSTRAYSRSANQSGIAQKSICGLSPNSLA